MSQYDQIHLIIDVATPIAIALLAYVGLMIKNNQAQVKADLLKQQQETKDELSKKHDETQRQLDVHVARDDERFEGISRTLTRIENKLNERTAGVSRRS